VKEYVAYWNTEDDGVLNEVIAAQRDEEHPGTCWPICITYVPTGTTEGLRVLCTGSESIPEERIIAEADTFLGIVVRIQRLCNEGVRP